MKENQYPLIHNFINENKYYVYDSQKNCILNLKKELYYEILKLKRLGFKKYKQMSVNSDEVHIVNELMKRGYFSPSPVRKVENLDLKWVDKIMENKIKYLILNVTYNCNFKCRYCNFANNNPTIRNTESINMKWEIAEKALDFALKHSTESEILAIGFYGGEPLMNFDVIKKTIDYCSNILTNKRFEFSMTTNLSLLNEKMLDFLILHNVDLLVSFDGPKNIHDSHRLFANNGKGTYDKIIEKLKYIKERSLTFFEKHIQFNSVIMPYDDMIEIESFFKERFPKNAAYMNNADLSKTEFLYSVAMENKDELQNTSLSKGEKALLYGLKDYNVFYEVDYPVGQCIPGYTRLLVNLDGCFYPCEKVNVQNEKYIIGDIEKGFNINNIKEQMNFYSSVDSNCVNCWAFKLCNMCIANCDNGNNFSEKIKDENCERIKNDLTKVMIKYLNRRNI